MILIVSLGLSKILARYDGVVNGDPILRAESRRISDLLSILKALGHLFAR